MWRYRNPVDILFGPGSFGELPRLLGGRRYAVVTYGEPVFAELRAQLAAAAGPPVLIVEDVAPNPDCALLDAQAARFRELPAEPEAIVALGGGSVIDSAKVFAAAKGDFSRVMRFLTAKDGGETLGATPILAVPTTAGTGSEVTCWATVWDMQAKQKYSLSRPNLYPEHAIVDPLLMLGKPRPLTISTGLDALSHALESLWNVNANPVSANHAVAAAREIVSVLPSLIADLRNVELRTRMAKAALFAGLAFSNTKTAIAHSISYPITLERNVPHGIACSFTLPIVMRSVTGLGGLCDEGLRAVFGDDLDLGAARLAEFLESLDVATDPRRYGIGAEEWTALVEDALGGERGRNFIGSKEALLAASSVGRLAAAQ